jgi:hypothetical protein
MTGLTSNIDELIEKFQGIQSKAANIDFSEALLVGVNAARAAMDFRIFNEGKDSNEVSLGAYTGKKRNSRKKFKNDQSKQFLIGGADTSFTPYELKRVNRGRQIRYKDLEFTGDLRRGIVVVKESSTRVVCVIPNDALALIAQGQEEQVGEIRGGGPIKIFSLSERERDILKTNTNAALKQLYDRLLNP